MSENSCQACKELRRDLFIKAVDLIETWHNMGLRKKPEIYKGSEIEAIWRIYYEKAPEMEFIRNELGSFWPPEGAMGL